MLATIDAERLGIGVLLVAGLLVALRPWHKPEEWRGAPPELRWFIYFSLAVVVAEFVVFGAVSDLRDGWNPYLGRSPVFAYVLGAPAAMSLCRERGNWRRAILLGVIGLWSAVTLCRFWARPERPGETDPYFQVSPYQLIWTVGVPLLWMVVLLSPRVNRYCTSDKPAPAV